MKALPKILLALTAFAALSLAYPASVQAVPTTYQYTGNPFTFVTGPYTTSMFVTVMVTLAHPLHANMPPTQVFPTAFTFFDGVQTITNFDAHQPFFSFATDGAGHITGWQAVTSGNGPLSFIETALDGPHNVNDVGQISLKEHGFNTFSPGEWSGFVAVPDAGSTLSLMTLTLMALGLVARRSQRAAVIVAGTIVVPTQAQVNVTMEHNNASRDGLYTDSAFTQTAAANLHRDLNFNGTIFGSVYAQPLYIENGPNGAAMIIVATEANRVYALDAITGNVIWQRNVGTPVSNGLPCPGNINPLGITGTPVVDLGSRALFFDAMVVGSTIKHLIFSLNVDTGATRSGWPVHLNAKARYNGLTFDSSLEHQRAALGLLNGTVYASYSGHFDCGEYHGWVVGVPINNPSNVTAWATSARGGGIWGHGGPASATNLFVVTGNTFDTFGHWSGGEAVIRLLPGPVFSGNTKDYWVPTNWLDLDNGDTDLGGCGPVVITVNGATPSKLVLALGKDGKAYLLNRNNLGGIRAPVASAQVATSVRGQAAATYRTSQGTYFVFRATSGAISAYRITATHPPTIVPAWNVSQNGQGSPWVTTTNGTDNAVVWAANSGNGDQRVRGFNGDTGAVVYDGGGPNELMNATSKWNTGIVARGRMYFAGTNKVYAFALP